MPSQKACWADDADVALAIEQAALGGQTKCLQTGQADIYADNADDLAAFHEREGDTGHQYLNAVGVIDIGIQQARFAAA